MIYNLAWKYLFHNFVLIVNLWYSNERARFSDHNGTKKFKIGPKLTDLWPKQDFNFFFHKNVRRKMLLLPQFSRYHHLLWTQGRYDYLYVNYVSLFDKCILRGLIDRIPILSINPLKTHLSKKRYIVNIEIVLSTLCPKEVTIS